MRQQGRHKRRTATPITVAAVRNDTVPGKPSSATTPVLRPGPIFSAYNYGYAAGYGDQHGTRSTDRCACEREPDGYLQWLTGWREGQKHRRRDFPLEAMLYEPLWAEQPSAGKSFHTSMKRVCNMTMWAVQTKMLHKDAQGQEHVVWELVPYFTALEPRFSRNGNRILHYPIFPTREAARVWKRDLCPTRGRYSQTRIRPISQIELVANMPEGVCTIIRSLEEVAVS